MKFDVIIGNPPYQLSDAGHGTSATPIYHKFVDQAKKLNPRYLVMIIPSRWFAGGKGLSSFREEMLSDKRIKFLIDFQDSTEVFPGVDVAGGICYFLWDRNYEGNTTVKNIYQGEEYISNRPLNEFPTFIRHGESVKIVKKALKSNPPTMDQLVSSRKPFGLPTNYCPTKEGDILLRYNGGEGKIQRETISVGVELIDKWKVITSKVSYDHGGMPDKNGQRRVLSILDILPPKSACTETYIIASSFDNETEAKNLLSYLKTKFARFLISQLSFSQDITKDRFAYVPIQDFSKPWIDEELYLKYELTPDEINFIESTIKPMPQDVAEMDEAILENDDEDDKE